MRNDSWPKKGRGGVRKLLYRPWRVRKLLAIDSLTNLASVLSHAKVLFAVLVSDVLGSAKAFVTSLYSEQIPTSVKEAQGKKNWREAMETEMHALVKHNTWEKCILPKGKKTVGCRWVYSIKYKLDGSFGRYKARLVAKGYTQTIGSITLRHSLPLQKWTPLESSSPWQPIRSDLSTSLMLQTHFSMET
ncbi:uncharacterized mitochondrial protein AtMg00820-like [Helianthus annuus]|uniref:uncharacterized mitochondrial protein AtMg00820-like n=1 Tax=Helianthus annuus TaxID=4232 RepID=UPI000B900DDC|nr:uncharacterized mitochondrial protein AtMg00820-like [Helianthus annuus]